ncbi:MAG: hypothetical protein ACO1RX_19800 [Candidatus Sericytochromatia bacterium]
MQLRHVFASTLSLALVACQLSAPTPVMAPAAVPAVSRPFKATVPQSGHQLAIQQAGQSERLQLRLSFPRGFRTQLAQPDELAFVRVTLNGQGIASRTQDGAALIPVVNGEASASFDDIPLQDGNLRLITVEGLNADEQVIPSFEASGWYRSQSGVTQINRVLNRAQNVLVDVLSALLNDPVLETLDIDAYADELDALMGYNAQTGEFAVDPLRLDTSLLATRLQNNEPPGELITLERPTQQVSLSVSTALEGQLAEDLYLVINDPLSDPQFLPQGRPAVNTVTFSDVPTGTWQLRAYRADGSLLSEQAVTVATSAVTATPLVLNNSEELAIAVSTTQSLGAPRVAADDDGDYVVVWQGYDASSNGIFARRYASSGRPLGEAFQVNTYTQGNQNSLAVAMDADGDFVVAWSSYGQDGSGGGVYAQRYTSRGQTAGSEFRVNNNTSGSQSLPQVGLDAEGDFVVTWHSLFQDGDTYGIYARRYASTGTPQTSEFLVNTWTTGAQFVPSLAMNAAGEFAIAWQSVGQDGDYEGIYAQRYNSAGSPEGSEFQVNTYTSGTQSNSQIALDSDGDLIVVWESFQDGDGRGIYAQRYDSAGSPEGSEFQVNTYTTGFQSVGSLAMDASGDWLMAWISSGQDGNGAGVYAQRYSASGLPDGSEFRVNTYTQRNQNGPSVAADASGGFVLAWQSQQDGLGTDLYTKRYQEPAPPP